jgi:protein TonB
VRVIEADPPGLFEREARRAAVRSRYVPLRENGQPVASEVTKPFVFRMDGGR